jgi:hypothetical protein
MKKKVLGLIVGFLFIGINGFAADGDLIVNGNLGIGTTNPGAKLDVQGGSVKVGGIFITHVTRTNPTCPAGKGTIIARKFDAKTCYDSPWGCGTCTTTAGWSTSPPTCQYTVLREVGARGWLRALQIHGRK